jgi:hypothetical protein
MFDTLLKKLRCVFKYLSFFLIRSLVDESQERLDDEDPIIFCLAHLVDFAESISFNVFGDHVVGEAWCLRPMKVPPVLLAHHDVPLVSTKMPVFNDIDSPSFFLLVSTSLGVW